MLKLVSQAIAFGTSKADRKALSPGNHSEWFPELIGVNN
jgi:hypothetical protein